MSRKKRKRGRGRVLILVVLLALIVFGVFARGIFTSGKTTTEHAQRELHTYAEQHETSLADYPDALVQLYARNPDARDFVRDYPKKKDLTPTIDLSNLSGSKTVPLLLQWDERWGYREYNESIIGLAGCGPTCLSMATIYLTGDTTKDPLWMCRFAEQNQFNVPGSGSKWALISEGGRMLGLDVTQIPLDKDRIYRNLDVGNPIIVVVGPGDFTTDGHFLVLTGHDGDKITLSGGWTKGADTAEGYHVYTNNGATINVVGGVNVITGNDHKTVVIALIKHIKSSILRTGIRFGSDSAIRPD